MVTEISPREFVARRDAGEELLLLDVREPQELAMARLPGSVHIPMGEVPDRLGELDPDRQIVVMCRSGGRSLQVARFLESHGYRRVHNLSGGIVRWTSEIDPSLPPC